MGIECDLIHKSEGDWCAQCKSTEPFSAEFVACGEAMFPVYGPAGIGYARTAMHPVLSDFESDPEFENDIMQAIGDFLMRQCHRVSFRNGQDEITKASAGIGARVLGALTHVVKIDGAGHTGSFKCEWCGKSDA